MDRIRIWWQNIMIGRYGHDQLNRAMLIFSLVVLVLYWLTKGKFFWILLLLSLGLSLLRMFSRNFPKRRGENQKYLEIESKVKSWLGLQKKRWQYRKTHVYYHCPHCQAVLRVPRKQGRIRIKCNKCNRSFEKTT